MQLCVLTLGYSSRQVVRVFRQQRQRHWLLALEEAFRIWDGVPEKVLVDNAKALVSLHNPGTAELVINPLFAAFARHWGFTPKACWPYRESNTAPHAGIRNWLEVGDQIEIGCIRDSLNLLRRVKPAQLHPC